MEPLAAIQQLHAWIRAAVDLSAFATFAAAVLAFGAAYLVTLAAGGTHTAFPHLFYVPVLLIALRWGPIAGGIAGIAAGLLCGPLMLLNVADATPQSLSGWLTRMGFFIGIGLLSGAITQRTRHRHQRAERLHQDAIGAFVRTIDAKSPYTARHSERVADFAVLIAEACRMPQSRCDALRWAGLVHDIGKLWIPDEVLNKANSLTDEEWELIKQHTIFSEQFLRDVDEFHPYLAAARGHHERYDGTGYPDGLVAEQIPLEARILAVADAFEAMTAERPYRPALSFPEALSELEYNAGTQFDPEIVHVFRTAIQQDAVPAPVNATEPDTKWESPR